MPQKPHSSENQPGIRATQIQQGPQNLINPDWLYDILSGYTSKFELPLVLEKFRGSVNCNKHESLNLRVYHWIKDSN